MAVEQSGGSSFASSPVNRDKPIGNGKNCHQCRQNRDFLAACKNKRNGRQCSIKLCSKCLLNRYGEKAEEVATFENWSYPKCRGICNCSVCMKKRGHQPTGILIKTAKATGFAYVSEMLLKSAEHINHEDVGTGMTVPLKMEAVFSPRRGKENSFAGKLDADLPKFIDKNLKNVKAILNGKTDDNASSKIINQDADKRETNQEVLKDRHGYNKHSCVLSTETDSRGPENKPKKMKSDQLGEMRNGKVDKENKKQTSFHVDDKKCKKSRRDGLDGNDDGKKGNAPTKKLKVSDGMSNQGAKHNNGVDPEANMNFMKTVTEKDMAGINGKDKQKIGNCSNTANVRNFLNQQTAVFHADNPSSVGTDLTSVS